MSGRSGLDGQQCFPAVDFMQFGLNDPHPGGFHCHSQWTPSYFLNLVKANDMRKLSLLISHFCPQFMALFYKSNILSCVF